MKKSKIGREALKFTKSCQILGNIAPNGLKTHREAQGNISNTLMKSKHMTQKNAKESRFLDILNLTTKVTCMGITGDKESNDPSFISNG